MLEALTILIASLLALDVVAWLACALPSRTYPLWFQALPGSGLYLAAKMFS